MDRTVQDFGASPFLDRLWNRIEALPRMSWIAAIIAVVALAVVALSPRPFWENDLARLTPVPEDLLLRDQQLRAELGTPDVRYLLVVDAARQRCRAESARGSRSRIASVGRATALSADTITRRAMCRVLRLSCVASNACPMSTRYAMSCDAALAGTPFRPDVFEPFAQDIQRARTLPPLSIEAMRNTSLGASMDMLISQRRDRTNALVTFSGVQDVAALRAFAAAAGDNVRLLDTKGESEALVAAQRTRMLWTLAVASLLLIGVIAFALRRESRVYRVLAPMALTTLLVLAVLRGSGVSLNLFHLIALILAAGLGLDYALFFEHAADDRAEQRRTLHAVLVCSLSTLMVFALLMISDVPVLRAIGVTVTLGVVFNFVLALLLTRPVDPVASRH